MRTYYIEKGEEQYQCPYCDMEIVDCTGDNVETHTEHCPRCCNEFKVEVI